MKALTAREKSVSHFLPDGHSRKFIAAELRISPKTLDIHLANIRRKIKVETTFQAGLFFAKHPQFLR